MQWNFVSPHGLSPRMLGLFLELLLISSKGTWSSSELRLSLEIGCLRFLRIDGELLKFLAAVLNAKSGSLQSTEIPLSWLGGVHKETELNAVWM